MNSSYLEQYVTRVKGGGTSIDLKQELIRSGTQGSYFEKYKEKMKKLKKAGLQADQNIFGNSITQHGSTSPSTNYSSIYMKGAVARKGSLDRETPLHLKASQSLSPVGSVTSPLPIYDDKRLSYSWSGAEFSEFKKAKQVQKPADLNPISDDTNLVGGMCFVSHKIFVHMTCVLFVCLVFYKPKASEASVTFQYFYLLFMGRCTNVLA